jgi:hypothetical protein
LLECVRRGTLYIPHVVAQKKKLKKTVKAEEHVPPLLKVHSPTAMHLTHANAC